MVKREAASSFLLLVLVHLLPLFHVSGAAASPTQDPTYAAVVPIQDPTYGFTSLPLNSSHLRIQSPYNLPVSSRYTFSNGVHKLWVLSSDKPHYPKGRSSRTEIRVQGYDYSSGVWQFEGHTYVPVGTSGVCIMQVFGAERTATTLMLTVYDGALMYYRSQLIADDIYSKWFRLNVIHNVGARQVRVFIDGVLKLTASDRGGDSHYFKCGVYTQQNYSSYFMQSLWKGIKILKLSE